ncbi:homoserine O-acetyltransferase MetX [Alteriqipengyuania lutimaris]|uniref:Homoserine O-acetyltransferase n=1 Tax=Alteriqipengyuania lutimaris TaxID=1538146 RepID=A0A395LKI3_9SPHN|nr:homoserine O-acetyltransferase [Alteriqipengyuania lutimaris]MBB3033811.1 homoserine O-acetyltransferase [Alteriqipengyuania lutimaris]RDS77215.1 homoserine O-acetyltransferase [Alteriqipengyuania lutimaris]
MNTPQQSLSLTLTLPDPLPLDSGAQLSPVTIAYQQYGEPRDDGSNVVLIFHALTGDQYVASPHPATGRPGWWDRMVGPGKPIDTDRFCVICANVIGGCMGSTGPTSADPSASGDGTPYGPNFPVVTIHDMVRGIARLLDALGIDRVHAVVGGSMGGMQALAFASDFPERAERVLVLASAARQSAQNIAFHEVGRQAIMADANWNGGDYHDGPQPDAGLAVARMAAHITYLSEAGLTEKFGRRLQDRDAKSFGFEADFQVESYLRYQGSGFTRRFDANSYLYITRAMDYFDLAEKHGGRLADAFAHTTARFCIVSFDTDWLYPTEEGRHIVRALNAAGAPVSFVELSSPYGHDGFLLDTPGLDEVVRGFVS